MKIKSHVIKPLLDKEYPTVSHGRGVYLYDTEGKAYIDGCSGAITANIGHGVQSVIDAMKEQAQKVSFTYRSQFTSDAAEELATKLASWAPGDLDYVFFVNSGSEATETAMKIAIQYWQEQGRTGKNKILSRWMSYHGITLGALSMSGHILRRKRFIPLLEEFPSVEPPYCYRCPFGSTYPSCDLLCANQLEQAIHRIGADNIAAFIAEPIIGASAGAVTPPPYYYQRIKEICERYEILFIADEVMTGNGRTGKPFGIDHWGVVPDLMALGKGMSAGYTPMAATIASKRIIDVIAAGSKSIMSGHTFSANPQSAAVSLAVMKYIEDHRLIGKVEERGQQLIAGLQALMQKYEIIGDVRGKGLLCGMEFVKDRTTKEPFPFHLRVTERLIEKAMNNGLLIYSASGGIDGQAGDAILVAPPFVITEEEINELLFILDRSLGELALELEQEGQLASKESV
ncbi:MULTISPECIES: aspartate aminotransferase family protein [Aneurinibacillus]|uniref:Adenosylmethionine-8-amino-7-oxononanoate aminotransferase n=1 Tax=Aneurinibacillus thermoaerophilus TaxID=143495 RepID=A0A1G8D523_ANETH|nr:MULTISPECIES: aspartate aminotransferase family protein [Aneurinibacillus]MED0675760.1 aspartate aminotransferase family protein [Aneurinibacillus thermoaerophilus]MED0680697.1 aspartate aminotransferase family protein [Aneurinibacillus thermoaerophilus]MED0736802.1 aspartate aminotransferase family protein [Aneurinibacillus thermoaerophilus]MED0758896.1 aspartate aminotransferase family protein [Aneurinibacillus thermoaerophilus]MED0761484.1 aspartate aminotransferase family protein [Aneur